MRYRKLTFLCAFGAVSALGAFTGGAASAAPKPDPFVTITVTCDGGQTFATVTTAGGGNSSWAPAFIGHQTFVPIAFGPFTGTGPDGPFVDPARVQNQGKGGSNERRECTYTIDTPPGPFHFEGSGSITVAVVGKP